MSFTKVTSAGIGSTELVTLDSLEVINNASIGGVLTYEDVTNVDSIGIITARAGVLVGSGITLSKDGDVFFTGIATGNGSGLTALNASNIGSGTVPTARLGSGTASSSTFLRGDSTFQVVNTDLVSDTSPQLGGNLASNGNDILMADSDQIKLGAGNDLLLYHNGSDSFVAHVLGSGHMRVAGDSLKLMSNSGDENYLVATKDGAVELYYDNTVHLATDANGIHVTTNVHMNDNGVLELGTSSDLQIFHSGTYSMIKQVNAGTGDLYIDAEGSKSILIRSGDGSSGAEAAIVCNANAATEIYHSGTKKFETTSAGASITGNAVINLTSGVAGQGELAFGASGRPFIEAFDSGNHGSGAGMNFRTGAGDYMAKMKFDNAVELYYDNTKRFETSSSGAITTGKSKVNGGTTARSLDVETTHSSGGEIASFQNNANNAYGGLVISGGEIDRETRLEAAWGSGFLTFWCDNSERMRIAATGSAFFNGMTALTASSTNKGVVHENQSLYGRTNYHAKTGAGTVPAVGFYHSGSAVGTINYTASSTQFNTSSDYRLKENVTAISDGIARLKTLKPSRFNFKVDTDTTVDGFLAHEVTAVPEAISGTKDEVDSDNKPVYQTIDHSKLVPLLTAALQEEISKREALETRIAALEG